MHSNMNNLSILSSLYRVLVLCLLLIGTGVFIQTFDSKASVPIDKPLYQFPQKITGWESGRNQDIDEKVLDVLKLDDYVYRDYASQGKRINFYASYFSYVSNNKGYHSPLNCMPGSGWNIASTSPVFVELPSGKEVEVMKLILQKGSQREVSLYWYQCRGRIIHSEYTERVYRVIDSLLYGRSDGAFIRLIATNGFENTQEATAALKTFAGKAIPKLWNYLPE